MGTKKRFKIKKNQRWKRRMERKKLAGHKTEVVSKQEKEHTNDAGSQNQVSGEQPAEGGQPDSK